MSLGVQKVRASSEAPDDFLRALAHAPSTAPPLDLAAGTVIGARYVVEQKIGRGGMGTVYLAHDKLLGRQVAIKRLRHSEAAPDEGSRARLVREARIAASLEHERIARVYDVGDHEGSLFVAMELVRGCTLRQWMSGTTAPVAEVVSLAQQIAEGLAVLHANHITHRDLKPENVMISDTGGVKLLDFGLARHSLLPAGREGASAMASDRPEAGASTAMVGTPGYMAPEQWRGEVIDARIDVFAFGVVLHELLVGQRPPIDPARGPGAPAKPLDFTGDAWRRIPAALQGIVSRALALEPAERFADGRQLRQALAEVAVTPAALSPVSRRWSNLRRRRVSLPLAALLVAGAATTLALGRRAPPLPPAPTGMAWIDAGTLKVGLDPSDLERECAALGTACDRRLLLREVPAARVTLPAFLLDRHEVTNQEMAETLNTLSSQLYVVEDEDSHQPRYVRFNKDIGKGSEVLLDLHPSRGGIQFAKSTGYVARPGRERLPVVQVSWHGAHLFCATRGKRLPTEDEWEAAARGRENRRYPWGDAPLRAGGAVLPRDGLIVAEPDVAEKAALALVGTAWQDVTPAGIHDLAGNVTEWTDSVYVEGDRGAGAVGRGPALPKVIRGGSWAESSIAKSSARNRRLPSAVGVNLGFRCASGR